ncbi:MAG: ABC transporter permease [Caldilineaceae bacterium]|nr:ABC transporter permease [Caldilineaceae bacterium]MCY4522312.1 ABC transporter permease [Caldilineaceae bacterium]
MLQYILQRVLLMIPTLFGISLLSFGIIQLPPGDYLTFYVAELSAQGEEVSEAMLAQLERQYGLGRPWYVQYFLWVRNIITKGDFGRSFTWNKPVNDLIWDRVGYTMMITLLTVVFVWIVALLIGKYAATHQYSPGDYIATFVGFIGLAVPNFLLALLLLYYSLKFFGLSPAGLFSPEYQDAPWSVGKWIDFLSHLWIPIVILGTAGTAGSIRIMRANLLDELHKPYVITARAKGVPERTLIWRYPVRVALNPFISTVGWTLPELVSGSVIVSVVLNLPTTGPLLLGALLQQDMFLAGSFILLVSVLTVIGTLISDILLAWLDPRIRLS